MTRRTASATAIASNPCNQYFSPGLNPRADRFGFCGSFVRSLPEDPWGRPYQLAVPGQNGSPFDIFSLGADGSPGGEGENADIRGSEAS